MTCISDELVQKFADGEASPSEISLIESHITLCSKCANRVENQRILSANFKKAIDLLSKEPDTIPEFKTPTGRIKKSYLIPAGLYYVIAAASIIIAVLVINHKEKKNWDNERSIGLGRAIDVDANRPVNQYPLVISIIDSEGEMKEIIN